MPKPKIAGAPISWGVIEVPDWGVQLDPDRVLGEMQSIGMTATEFGPEGFLPAEPAAKAQKLSEYGIKAVGGFFPVVLHDENVDAVALASKELESYNAANAEVLVIAAHMGVEGYDAEKPTLDEKQWGTLLSNLSAIKKLAAEQGVEAVIHPHLGTMVEVPAEILRVVRDSDINFCLDSGHMLIAGTDPVEFVSRYPERIAHCHMKDVNLEWAEKVTSGELTYKEAVVAGLYSPLGQGDVDSESIVRDLVQNNYQGWFVLEQDILVPEFPEPMTGPYVTAKQSYDFLVETVAKYS